MMMSEVFLFMFPASFTSCLFADADGSAVCTQPQRLKGAGTELPCLDLLLIYSLTVPPSGEQKQTDCVLAGTQFSSK